MIINSGNFSGIKLEVRSQFFVSSEQHSNILIFNFLDFLSLGKTKRDITLAGNLITELKIDQTFSFAVQERVMKVTAMTGLIQLSTQLLNSMVVENKHIPSSIGYTAVLNGLRKVKRFSLLQQTISNLSKACKETNQSLETVALNIFIKCVNWEW